MYGVEGGLWKLWEVGTEDDNTAGSRLEHLNEQWKNHH